jgi:hypothetical protein
LLMNISVLMQRAGVLAPAAVITFLAMGEPAKRRATYEDLLAVPAPLIADHFGPRLPRNWGGPKPTFRGA